MIGFDDHRTGRLGSYDLTTLRATRRGHHRLDGADRRGRGRRGAAIACSSIARMAVVGRASFVVDPPTPSAACASRATRTHANRGPASKSVRQVHAVSVDRRTVRCEGQSASSLDGSSEGRDAIQKCPWKGWSMERAIGVSIRRRTAACRRRRARRWPDRLPRDRLRSGRRLVGRGPARLWPAPIRERCRQGTRRTHRRRSRTRQGEGSRSRCGRFRQGPATRRPRAARAPARKSAASIASFPCCTRSIGHPTQRGQREGAHALDARWTEGPSFDGVAGSTTDLGVADEESVGMIPDPADWLPAQVMGCPLSEDGNLSGAARKGRKLNSGFSAAARKLPFSFLARSSCRKSIFEMKW